VPITDYQLLFSTMAKSPFSMFSSFGPVGSIFNVLKEVDVRPARDAAESPFLIVFASRDAAFAEYLAALMYRGERQHDMPAYRAAITLPLDAAAQLARANFVIIVTRADGNNEEELRVLNTLLAANVPALLCYLQEQPAAGAPSPALPPPPSAQSIVLPQNVITLLLVNGTLDEAAAVKKLTQAIRQRRVIDELALARYLPAFREPVVKAMIEDVAIANAAYSLGTGILQINPITGLPLTVADTVILTKNQAVMAYKIALAMGMQSDFKSVMPEIAGVIGGGLILRQAARSLIGLLPGLGILPKVAISFAGTVAIGEAVYLYASKGEAMTADGLKAMYNKALERGQEVAASLQRKREASGEQRAARKAQKDAERMRASQPDIDAAPIPLPPASNDAPAV
jgi:uncharacterized protein (DUF697 family)